jgi:hypothetical protein
MDLHSTDLGFVPFTFIDQDRDIVATKMPHGDIMLRLRAPEIEFSGDFMLHTQEVEQQFFAMSLNKDGSHYYLNNKAFGVRVTGEYNL